MCVYPLFKSHKLTPEELKGVDILNIPTRLVLSVGNAYLSRITTLLEEILNQLAKFIANTMLMNTAKIVDTT